MLRDKAENRAPKGTHESGAFWLTVAVCVLLAAGVLAVFGQTTSFEFVSFDDDDYVFQNPHVTGGLTYEGIRWAFTAFHAHNWHPLTWLSHMLDCQIYGSEAAGGHHRTNVLLHAVNAVLLFLVLRRMTGALWPSALVAAVFAVHPLRVESVAWVSERKDLLSGLFFLLTLAAYVRYASRPFALRRYLLVVVLFALGLMAKPMLVTLPFVLLLLDYWPLGRLAASNWDHRVLEKLPLLLLVAGSCLATIRAQSEIIQDVSYMPLAGRFANACVSYDAYLGQMVWPANLAAIYPYPKDGVSAGQLGAALLLLAGISFAALVWRRKHPYLLIGWLWYLGMLVPVIGLMQVGLQAHADRYTYLPQIGVYIAVVWLVAAVSASWPHRGILAGVVSAALLAALVVSARQQTTYWRDSDTLWIRALACTSENATAHATYGKMLIQKQRFAEAEEQLRQAVRINNKYGFAYNQLGVALAEQGKLRDAVDAYKTALSLIGRHAGANSNLGKAYWMLKEPNLALEHFKAAVAIDPNDADTQNSLGYLLLQQGKTKEAIACLQSALRLKSDFAVAEENLGDAWLRQGEAGEALSHFQKASDLNPRILSVQMKLALTLRLAGKLDEAIQRYEQALALATAQKNAPAVEAIRQQIQSCRAAAGR